MPKTSNKDDMPQNAPPNGKSVLVVEDEEAMGKVLTNKFIHHGFECIHATNGTEALEKMKEQVFDIIILDLLMPGKDGFNVLMERGDGMNAKTPVFVLTNLGEEETLKKALGMGATECFTKSNTSLNDLVIKVKEQVGV